MYTEGAQTTGYHRFLQHSDASAPCACQNCVHYEQLYGHDSGVGHQAASARQTDRPSQDAGTDIPAPRGKDVGGRALVANRLGPRDHRSPHRRPVFAGLGHYNQTEDLSQVCPWELNPAQWIYPLESRHYPSVREQCGCVVRSDTRTHPSNALVPHPLPHLQVRGQGYRHRRTIRYVTVDEEEEGCGCSSEPHSPPLPMPNGHGAPRPVFFERGGGRDNHQDWGRQTGGSEEDCNGQSGAHKCFFPTEVPQKQLNQSRRTGPRAPSSGVTSPESSITTTINSHRCQAAEAAKQKRRQDSVRDQIRQVVTDLEDVLGGLKQVHVEMKEVVQQIDRLTANIDLSDETPGITQESSNNFHGSAHLGELRPVLKPAAAHAPLRASEDRIILRTNSPSPVHIASVVKTSCFIPPGHTKDANPERPVVNGHLPHTCPPRDSKRAGHTAPEPHPQSLDPKVIIGNIPTSSKNHKPPPYPQNGRCGKGLSAHAKPLKTPANSGRGRQSTSMV